MDRELAAALAGELPAAANVKVDDAVPVAGGCPDGGRGAMFTLAEGGISVVLMPPGAQQYHSADGVQAAAATSTGREVIVRSQPRDSADSPPYLAELNRYATTLARLY